jgi:hypothetical protein
MEAIGGVGYCEDSTLPALVRNTHVQSIWEGTTNVLSLDLLRAAARSGAIQAIADDVDEAVFGLDDVPAVSEAVAGVRRGAHELRARWARMDDDAAAQKSARSFAMGLGMVYACARLCKQGAWAATRGSNRTALIAQRLAARGLVPPPPPDDLDLAMDE